MVVIHAAKFSVVVGCSIIHFTICGDMPVPRHASSTGPMYFPIAGHRLAYCISAKQLPVSKAEFHHGQLLCLQQCFFRQLF